MSRGLGKTEQAVLAFIEANRRDADTGLDAALPQQWIVKQMASDYSGAAIRRAILSLVRKERLHKLTELCYGVLVDIEPVTQCWHYSGKHLEPVELRPTLPDFEPLILERLGTGAEKRIDLTYGILRNTDGCWRMLRGRGNREYRYPRGSARMGLYRAINRLIEERKIIAYPQPKKWEQPGTDVWLALPGGTG